MKIGLLGGSFNPVHNGHLAIAQAACGALALDAVWFLPSGNHPLKKTSDLWPYALRKRLLEIALQPYPQFRLSELDADTDKPSYTVQLLRRLYREYPQHHFIFIIGYDIVPQLPRWFRFEWLVSHAEFAVFTRPGFRPSELQSLPYATNFTFFTMSPVDISSTAIRQTLERGEAVDHLLPPGVAEAIQQER